MITTFNGLSTAIPWNTRLQLLAYAEIQHHLNHVVLLGHTDALAKLRMALAGTSSRASVVACEVIPTGRVLVNCDAADAAHYGVFSPSRETRFAVVIDVDVFSTQSYRPMVANPE